MPNSSTSHCKKEMLSKDLHPSLHEAIIHHEEAKALALIQESVDLETSDASGWSPLTLATRAKNKLLLKALVEGGARINQLDERGNTPLFIAIYEKDLPLATFLIQELGADANTPNGDSQFPLEYVTYNGQMESFGPLLHKAGASLIFINEWLSRKFLAHIWCQEGTTEIEDSRGVHYTLPRLGPRASLPRDAASPLLQTYLKSFTKGNPLFTHAQNLELDDAASHAVSTHHGCKITNAKVIERMKSGKPTIIFGGTHSPNPQSVSFVVTQKRLYVCNRGVGKDPDYAIRTYQLEPYMSCELLIARLRTLYPTMEALNQMLQRLPYELANFAVGAPDLDWKKEKRENLLQRLKALYPEEKECLKFLREPQLKLLVSECLKLNDSSEPNCVWASGVKGSVAALFAHYKKDPKVYKQFTAFSRKRALESYLEESLDHDIPLLDAIGQKLAKSKKHNDALTIPYEDLFSKLRHLTGRNFYTQKRVKT